MVVKGRFTAQLVDAQTKGPFREYVGQDGKFYVEAEPDVEYYIKVGVDFSDEESSRVKSDCYVDGQELDGYETLWTKQQTSPKYRGRIEENDDGEAKNKALRFEKFSEMPVSTSEDRSIAFGSVSVHFFTAIPENEDVSPSREFDKGDVPSGSMEKALRSAKGSSSIPTTIYNSGYTRGELLETITLQYGSAVGLIHAGILSKPPLWELARSRAPFKGTIDPRLAAIKPRIAKMGRVIADDGAEIAKGKEYEVFDLTCLAGSASEDDDSEDQGDNSEDDRKPAAVEKPKLEQEGDAPNALDEIKPNKAADQNENAQSGDVMEEEVDDDGDFGMDLKDLLGSTISHATESYQKQVDKFFINEYHGMPRDLFTNVYRRGRVFDAITTRVDSKVVEKILRRIMKWERAISKLNNSS